MNLLKQATALVVITLVLGAAGCGKSSSDVPQSSSQATKSSSQATKSSSQATKASSQATKASSDAAITGRVKAAISKEPALKGTKVSVSTDQKVVHLSGTVKSRDQRAKLIAVARKVEGVKAVKTDLMVKPQQKRAAGRKPAHA
jgi:hyperosmotically inducible periplasmic protein